MSWLDRLLPPRCLLCGDPGLSGDGIQSPGGDGAGPPSRFAALPLCAGCLDDCPTNASACMRCAEPLPLTAAGLSTLTMCGGCLWNPPAYGAIHVPYRYAAPLDWLLHRFKFRGDLAAGRLLGLLLAQAIAPRLPRIDAIIPIPLHARRLNERGYNQATELARPLARQLGAPIRGAVLQRARRTQAQMELPARARARNVQGAFRVHRPFHGRLLLVDDVVTTANTAREAARVLTALDDDIEVEVCALARA